MPRKTTLQENALFADEIRDNIDLRIDASIVLTWVQEHFSPDDVYTQSQLDAWAMANGYICAE